MTENRLQEDLKRARQFNTDSHSEIVSLRAELKKKEEGKNRSGGSVMMEAAELQRLGQELWEAKNAVHRLENESRQQQQLLLEAEAAKRHLEQDVGQLRQRLQCLPDDGMNQYNNKLHECLQLAFHFINAVLDDDGKTGNVVEHAASNDLLQQGTDILVGYLELVRSREGTDGLLEELRKAVPPKSPAPSSSSRGMASGKIRSALLQYHPDKHAGAGRWIRALCKSVTKLLNAVK